MFMVLQLSSCTWLWRNLNGFERGFSLCKKKPGFVVSLIPGSIHICQTSSVHVLVDRVRLTAYC